MDAGEGYALLRMHGGAREGEGVEAKETGDVYIVSLSPRMYRTKAEHVMFADPAEMLN